MACSSAETCGSPGASNGEAASLEAVSRLKCLVIQLDLVLEEQSVSREKLAMEPTASGRTVHLWRADL
jgi:hypothetical protein